MVSADSHRIPRAPCYWGPRPRSPPGSAYGAVTRCGPPSQGIRLPDRFNALRPAAAATGRTRPKQHRARNPRRVIARARFSHHPLPLATTHGISTPAGTEMFHFPASPPAPYDIQTRVTPHNGRRVPPFGNPRITARKPAPRGISQATASFIGPRCQGIHRTLIKTNNTTHDKTKHLSQTYSKMLASTIQFTTNPPTPTPHHQQAAEARARQPGRTAPEPRQHATPNTHTSTHQGHPPQQTTTTTTAAAAHHKQACFLHHTTPQPTNPTQQRKANQPQPPCETPPPGRPRPHWPRQNKQPKKKEEANRPTQTYP